jgi:hypothetical protein
MKVERRVWSMIYESPACNICCGQVTKKFQIIAAFVAALLFRGSIISSNVVGRKSSSHRGKKVLFVSASL